MLDCLATSGKHYGASWDYPFDTYADMVKMEHLVMRACSAIVFQKGATNLTEDDDKLRNQSEKAGKFGWTRSKGLRSFGPVNNMIAAAPCGCLIASKVTCFGKSTLDSTKVMLCRICSEDLDKNSWVQWKGNG